MYTSWYDCSDTQTTYLWNHEWDKHGKCVFQQAGMGMEGFFEKALELYEALQGDYSLCKGETECNSGYCYDLSFNPMPCPSTVTV